MKSRSFSFSNDEAGRFAKHRVEDFIRYEELGLPMVDDWSQITQTAMTAKDFFKSIVPQTNVQPVKNTPQPNNE